MIVQNNGNRKYLIDGLVIEPHKTYNITEEQYNRIKGFNEIKPLCIINPQKPADKGKDKNNSKPSDKKPADKGKDKQATNTADNEQQPNDNK